MDNIKDKLPHENKMEDKLTEESFYLKDSDFYLKDNDFYPPEDNRTLDTYRRIYKGKDFEEYAEYIYNLYEEEGFYEN